MLHAPLLLPTAKLDISSLLKSSSPSPPPRTSHPPPARSVSVPTSSTHVPLASSPSTSTASHLSTSTAPPVTYAVVPPQQQLQLPRPSASNLSVPALAASSHSKRPSPATPHPAASPAKKQNSKWGRDEDALLISLRGSGMKWEDISNRLPGRTVIACRLHYQNYLERRQPWDEEKKDKLARLYDRIKPDIWGPLAQELGVPWRSAEAMHWQLGELEMARRAGAIPFAMAPSSSTTPANLSSSSSAPRMERSGSGYKSLEPASGSYDAVEDPGRASEEREMREGGRRQRPASTQLMQTQQLAPVGLGMDGGRGMILPSLAELTQGVPAFAGFVGEGRHRGEVKQARGPPRREWASQQNTGSERRGSEEPEVKEEEHEEPQRRQ